MAQEVAIWIEGEPRTPRHDYVAYIVFDVVLGVPYVWPEHREDWASFEGLKIGYAAEEVPESDAWIPSSGFLSQTELTHSGVNIWSDGTPIPCCSSGRLPFGVAAANSDRLLSDWWSWIFWTVTRLEEHQPHSVQLDRMNRFIGKRSIAYQEGWLRRPEVEARILEWAETVKIAPAKGTYKVRPTIDVDSAYAYLHRSAIRNVGSIARDVFTGQGRRLRERWNVWFNGQQDPYDTYDWLESVHRQHNVRATFFFLMADRGDYDRPVHWSQPGMTGLIRKIASTADIGIHPGVEGHNAEDSRRMFEEIQRLSRAVEAPIARARQHYLLQRCPASWNRLEEVGISHDYSLGYADVIGFRSGMSRPYKAFDAVANRLLDLTIHPTAAMDATLNRYMGLSPEQALDALERLADEVKAVDGELTLLWHNETVSECNEWEGWRAVYEQVFERVC